VRRGLCASNSTVGDSIVGILFLSQDICARLLVESCGIWCQVRIGVSVIKFSVIGVNNVISFYRVYNFVNLTLNPALG
jgi:hypothetical protein